MGSPIVKLSVIGPGVLGGCRGSWRILWWTDHHIQNTKYVNASSEKLLLQKDEYIAHHAAKRHKISRTTVLWHSLLYMRIILQNNRGVGIAWIKETKSQQSLLYERSDQTFIGERSTRRYITTEEANEIKGNIGEKEISRMCNYDMIWWILNARTESDLLIY